MHVCTNVSMNFMSSTIITVCVMYLYACMYVRMIYECTLDMYVCMYVNRIGHLYRHHVVQSGGRGFAAASRHFIVSFILLVVVMRKVQ